MSGGGGSSGGSSGTQVQTTVPWAGVRDYLKQGYKILQGLYTEPNITIDSRGKTVTSYSLLDAPQYFPDSTVATPNWLEAMGQQMQLGATGNMQDIGQAGTAGMMGLLGGANTANLGALGGFGAMDTLGTAGGDLYGMGTGVLGGGLAGLSGLAGQAGAYGNLGLGGALGGLGDFSGAGTTGLAQMLAGSGGFGSLLGGGASEQGLAGALQGMQGLLSAGDPSSNPYFQQAVQSAIRPLTEQFTEQVLPSIRSGAIGAGQTGSSREGVAQGIASRGYLDAVGDITSGMGNQAYAQGLQALGAGAGIGQGLIGQGLQAAGGLGGLGQAMAGMGLQSTGMLGDLGQGMFGQAGGLQQALAGMGGDITGMGLGAITGAGGLGQGFYDLGMTAAGRGAALSPQMMQALAYPGQMTEQIGQQLTADEQALINADIERWNYEQNLPYMQISNYLQMLSGAPWGSATTTNTGGRQSSTFGNVLGGAMTGYGLAGPWGALGGGLLGLF